MTQPDPAGAARFWRIVGEFARHLAGELGDLPAGAGPEWLELGVRVAAGRVGYPPPAGRPPWSPRADPEVFVRGCAALAGTSAPPPAIPADPPAAPAPEAKAREPRNRQLTCSRPGCGVGFLGSWAQEKRAQAGKAVVCSGRCKGLMAMLKLQTARGATDAPVPGSRAPDADAQPAAPAGDPGGA